MHESLRVFALCDAMRWSHLPAAGGLHDQSPEFIDDVIVLFGIKGRAQHDEMEKERRKAQAAKRK